MFSQWGSVQTFGVAAATAESIRTSNATSLPALGSTAYANGLLYTQCVGGTAGNLSSAAQAACANAGFATGRTTAQTNSALFWNDPGGTVQPPWHLLQIASTLMSARGLSLADEARLTSLLGMAMTDAGIDAWKQKYITYLWRPITAIRSCATDATASWNSDFTTCQGTSANGVTPWQSEIATPPHPDYLAGYPAFTASAVAVMQGFLGTDEVANFCSASDAYTNGNLGAVPQITMCFDRLSDLSSGPLGATLSRVYGGIHTIWAVNDAQAVGTAIGQDIVLNWVPEPASIAVLSFAGVALAGLRRCRRA
jgi:hypothetical protein